MSKRILAGFAFALIIALIIWGIGVLSHRGKQSIYDACKDRGLVVDELDTRVGAIIFCMDPKTRALFAP